MTHVRVFAPATVSNLGPGFDVLGLALSRPGDLVDAEWRDEPGIEIAEVTGDGGVLPTDPDRNVAGVAAASVLAALFASGVSLERAGGARLPAGVRLRVHKQMPLESGLGSSAASSVAGAVAVNELFGRPLSRRELLPHALAGERTAAGAGHADNAAPSLLGGITAIRGYGPLEVLDLPVPPALRLVVVHPHLQVETSYARGLLRGFGFPIDLAVANLGNMAGFVAALYRGDLELLGRCIEDRLVEPLRMPLIPGLAAVKQAAREAGALGCSISGSGPSVFALAADDDTADRVAGAMAGAFRDAADLESEAYTGPVNTEGAVQVAPEGTGRVA
ncbi:MAG TPA: homoserine kinase [Miltoncostaeaceae bacterium]|nr:homoserine kinase [Miltoncostaeaceae bacterium]